MNINSTINNKKILNKAIMLLLQDNPRNIKYIDNPNDEMCLIAVKRSGYYLSYIKNPSDKVIKKALEENPKRSDFIK